jgi:hypothetical protein
MKLFFRLRKEVETPERYNILFIAQFVDYPALQRRTNRDMAREIGKFLPGNTISFPSCCRTRFPDTRRTHITFSYAN